MDLIQSKKPCINAKLFIGLTTKPNPNCLGINNTTILIFNVLYKNNIKKTIYGQKSTSISRSAFYFLAVWTGLEPATPCVTGMYSNQLNYQTRALFTVSYTNKILGELHCECKYTTLFDSCKYFLKKR